MRACKDMGGEVRKGRWGGGDGNMGMDKGGERSRIRESSAS